MPRHLPFRRLGTLLLTACIGIHISTHRALAQTLPTASSTNAPATAAKFLALAAKETQPIPLTAENSLLLMEIARFQALAHDLPHLRATAAVLEKLATTPPPPYRPPDLSDYTKTLIYSALAGDFALAADPAAYRKYLAQALAHPDPRQLALAYADARDYPAMYTAAQTLNAAAQHNLFQTLARHLAPIDASAAHELLSKIAPLTHDGNFSAACALSYDYASINDPDAAFAQAQTIPPSSKFSPAIYENLATEFDRNLNRPAARRARLLYIAAFNKAPQKMQDDSLFDLFRCQIALSNRPAAAKILDRLQQFAHKLPQSPDSDLKHSYYIVAARAAARLGNDKRAADCLHDAAQSIAPLFANDPTLIAAQATQDSQDIAIAHAAALADQGHPDQAAALVAAIANPNRRLAGLRQLIRDATIRSDAPAAIAALAQIGRPDKLNPPGKPQAQPQSEKLAHAERLLQIPVVARLIADSALAPPGPPAPSATQPAPTIPTTAPTSATRVLMDPMQWLNSLPTPSERALAAITLAIRTLHPAPAPPFPGAVPD